VITTKLRSLLAAATLALGCTPAHAAGPTKAERPYRVLHVMSYHSPFHWSDQQDAGFREALAGLDLDYRVFRMDAQRQRAIEGWAAKRGREARALIEEWKPDLIYTTDDDAQEHVARHYVNSDLPIVFSGVDRSPETYGFVGARNVAGVPEVLHIAATVRLLQAVVPGAKRILIVSDGGKHWPAVIGKMREQLAGMQDVQVVGWEVVTTFDAYQRVMKEAPGRADAVWPLGLGVKDAAGRDVSLPEIMKWTVEHCRIPDLTVWDSSVVLGTLLAVTVSARQQGLAAGRLARAILADGASPASLPMVPAGRGTPVINLARASRLGLRVKSSVLLSTEVVERFSWEKP
jgi:ABC-type uncharacterized transport system substrate-binding protein